MNSQPFTEEITPHEAAEALAKADAMEYANAQLDAYRKTPPLFNRRRVVLGDVVLRGYKTMKVTDLTYVKERGWLVTCRPLKPIDGDAIVVPLCELRPGR